MGQFVDLYMDKLISIYLFKNMLFEIKTINQCIAVLGLRTNGNICNIYYGSMFERYTGIYDRYLTVNWIMV